MNNPASAPMPSQENLVSIYLKYIERITEHYHIGLKQFQLYFGFSAGLIALLGIAAKPVLEKYFENPEAFTIPKAFAWLLLAASLLGIILAVAWYLVMRDSRKWQLIFNQLLEEWEHSLLSDPSTGFYHRINASYNPSRRLGVDVIDLNQWLPLLFGVVWLLIFLVSIWFVV